jgi:hypothetical protein
VKLGPLIFRADRVTESAGSVQISARPGAAVSQALQERSDQPYGSASIRVAYENRVLTGQLRGIDRTVEAGSGAHVDIHIEGCEPARPNTSRFGTGGLSPDDIVDRSLRNIFFGESVPDSLATLGGVVDVGLAPDDLTAVFALSEEIVRPVARLVISDGLVGSGNASAITHLDLGTRNADSRPMRLEWIEPRVYSNAVPGGRSVEGIWRRQ